MYCSPLLLYCTRRKLASRVTFLITLSLKLHFAVDTILSFCVDVVVIKYDTIFVRTYRRNNSNHIQNKNYLRYKYLRYVENSC